MVSPTSRKIEVDEAWAFGDGGGAITAHLFFYREESVHQFERWKIGFEENGGIQKMRLVEVADGCSVVEA